MYCIHTDQKHQCTKTTITHNSYINVLFYLSKNVSIDKSVYSDKVEGQLGSLVCKIEEAAESAGIDVNKLKKFVIASYPSEEKEIQEADSLFKVLLKIRIKRCSHDNIEALKSIIRHFNLSDTLTDIPEYEEVNIITCMSLYLFCNLDPTLRSTQTCFRYW